MNILNRFKLKQFTHVLTVFLLSIAIISCGEETKKEPTEPKEKDLISWEIIKASYEKEGYRFVPDFIDLVGSTYSYNTNEGNYQFELESIKMGVNDDGQLFPIVLSGPILDAESRIEVNNEEWALESGVKVVSTPKSNVLFMGKDLTRIKITDYLFGIGPDNKIFTAYFKGVEVESDEAVSYQFSQVLFNKMAAIDCQLVPANFCAAYGTCTVCTVVRDAAGNQTGCSCTPAFGFCLWFTQDCANVACAGTCRVRKWPAGVYTCDC